MIGRTPLWAEKEHIELSAVTECFSRDRVRSPWYDRRLDAFQPGQPVDRNSLGQKGSRILRGTKRRWRLVATCKKVEDFGARRRFPNSAGGDRPRVTRNENPRLDHK